MLGAGTLAAAVALAACGGHSAASSGSSPQQAVQTAVSDLGAQSNVKVVLSLPISPAQAKELSAKSGGHMTTQEADALTSGTVFFEEATGSHEAVDSTQAMSDPNNAYDFGLTIGKDTLLEVRYVDQNLYVRAQLQKLLTDLGQDPASAAKFDNHLNSINTYVPGISELGQGKWVEISHSGLQSLSGVLKQMEQSSRTSVNPTTLRTDILKLRKDLLTAIQSNATFSGLSSSNGRQGYSATVNVANVVNTIKPEIASTLSSIPGLGTQISGALGKAQSSIPAGQKAVVDLYVSHNRLSEADLDLNQFAGKQKVGFPVPIRLAFSSPGAPKAPSGATVLDVSKVPGLLAGLLGGSHTTTG